MCVFVLPTVTYQVTDDSFFSGIEKGVFLSIIYHKRRFTAK